MATCVRILKIRALLYHHSLETVIFEYQIGNCFTERLSALGSSYFTVYQTLKEDLYLISVHTLYSELLTLDE